MQGDIIVTELLKIIQLYMVYFKFKYIFFQGVKNNFYIYVNI